MHIGTIKQIWRYPVKSMGGEQVQSTFIQSKGIADDRCWSIRDDVTGELVGGRKIPGLMMLTARYVQQVNTQFGKPVETVVEITFPDGQTLRSDDPYASAMLSMFLGRPVSLVSRPTPANKSAYKLSKPMTPAEVRYALGMKPDQPDPDFSSFSLGMLTTLSRYATPPGVLYDVYPLHLLTTSALGWISQFHPEGDFSVRRYRPTFLIETDPALEGIVENDWRGRELQIGQLRIHCNHPTIRCSMPGSAQPGLPKDPNIPLTLMKHAGQHLGAYATPVNEAKIQVGDSIELLPEQRGKLYSWFDQVGRRAKSEVLKANNLMGNLLDKQSGKQSGRALPPGFFPFKVAAKVPESADVVSIELCKADNTAIPRFLPGQHLVLAIPQANGSFTYRPYSISSGSHQLEHYRISVKLKRPEPSQAEMVGEGSGYIHQQLNEGEVVYAKGALGQFAIRPTDDKPLVLISAGIGITPYMSILQTLASENPSREVCLIHGLRSADNFPFEKELQGLQFKLPKLQVQIWLSGDSGPLSPQASPEAKHTQLYRGRIDVRTAISRINSGQEAIYMICGTPEFSVDMREKLAQEGVSDDQILTESFGPVPSSGVSDGKQYEIHFSRSGRKVIWNGNEDNLLAMAENQGIDASSGCRYGACQACEATLLSGEVAYSEGIQAPAGKNKILLCSARPMSNLDIVL